MAGQPLRKAARKAVAEGPVPAPVPGPVPAKARLHIPTLAVLSAGIRTLLINLCLLIVLAGMIPVIGQQFLRAQIIIDTFTVPPALVARGLGPEVAANRLWDGLTQVQAQAASSKEGVIAIPKSARVDFQVPDSGISIDSLVYYVRQFFHLYPTRISGEVVCADAECRPEAMQLRIRIQREKLEVIQMPAMGAQDIDAYFRTAALRVLAVLDPFLAAAALAQDNPAAALAQAERLVRLGSPDAVWAYNLIGTTRMTMGQTDAAIAAFRAALSLEPGFVIAQTNLGSALVAKGDYAGAGTVLDAVAVQHPGDRFLALGRYRLALAQGRTGDAIAQALKADTEDPGKALYLVLAAQAADRAQQTDAAKGYLQRALAVAPDDAAAVAMMNLILQLAGDYDQAGVTLRQALAVAPDNTDFLETYAQVLGLLHQFEPGLVQVEHALALVPDDLAAQKIRASLLQGAGRNQDAVVQLQALALSTPKDAEIPLMQGQSLQALGQNGAAAPAYRAAVALDPESVYAMMANAFLKTLR